MNILLINHYAGSPKYGMEFRPYYLAREWLNMGHKVRIVASSQSHMSNQVPIISGEVTREVVEGIEYFWLKTPSYHGNGVRRVLNIFTFVYKLFRFQKKVLKDFRPDIVIASSTHPLDIYPAYRIAKSNQAKLIFELHDLWPLSPIELGGFSQWHPFMMLLQHAENFAYAKADFVVSILPKVKTHMVSHGLIPEKFLHIPNGIVMSDWATKSTNLPTDYVSKINTLKNKYPFVIGYTGAHGVPNALDSLLEAAEQFKNSKLVSFVLVGKGSEKVLLQSKAHQLGLENILFLEPVEKYAIPKILEMMDVLYIGLKKQPLFHFGISPNKLLDYMMAGKPVIYAIDAGNNLVAESGCGISVPPEKPNAIAKAIMKLMEMSDSEKNKMGERGKIYVLENHDYNILARRFLEKIE